MDWHSLLQSLCSPTNDSELAGSTSVELVIGNTTFVLERDSDPGLLHVRGTLCPLPPRDRLKPESLFNLLKDNMELHAAGLGSVAVDTLDHELVWMKTWPLDSLQESTFHETLLHIDNLGSEWSMDLRADAVPTILPEEEDDLHAFFLSLEYH